MDAPFGRWLAAFAVVAFPLALIALAAAAAGRGDRRGTLRGPLLLVWLVLAGGFALLLALPQGGPDIPVVGLPLGTAVMLFVLVPVPFVLLCWVYAARFDRLELREEDLERIRRLAARPPAGRPSNTED